MYHIVQSNQSNFKFSIDYWRMIMATEKFVVTPANYTRQLEVDYRNQKETVTFAQLEKARNKCSRWLSVNREHFATVAKI